MSTPNVEKVTIRSYKDEKLAAKVINTFVIPINPEQFTRDLKIKQNDKKGQGNQGTDSKYSQTEPEKLRLDFFLDGTKTVEGNYYNDLTVTEQVKKFLDTAYHMNSDAHKPDYLRISWADYQFECLLESVSINYTLFDRGGNPLRAKISANFNQYINQEKRTKQEDKKSPDLTKVHRVKDNDKLPLLAFESYNKIAPYLEVAKINNLTNFRALRVGANLLMPPFEKNEI